MIELVKGEGTYILSPSKMICLLRSYAAHARELDNEVPEKPVFFLKPPSSLLANGGTVIIPPGSGEVHHEVELAVIIGKKGKDVKARSAGEHILGYTIMLDITARDIQLESKSKGLPWTEAKGYDTFAPVASIMVPAETFDPSGKRIWLEVNGELRQDSNTELMIWPVEVMISSISSVMTLEEGDIIMTGTPAGVGPLRSGDRVRAGIDGIGTIEVSVASADTVLSGRGDQR
jgi:2-keto-4-pentenoate hydratase/2-oxohepta-3-ene-1,7-dioic acid hydratase in catechol pathway